MKTYLYSTGSFLNLGRHALQIVTLCGLALLTMGQDGGGGCSSSPVHGGVDVGTTINPNDPSNLNVNVGGHINFAKRPLTPAEKAEIFKSAHDDALACNGCDERHELTKLTDRARYRYRVQWRTVRPIVDAGWKEGRRHDVAP